jgi:hypothetical protein
MNEQRKGAGGMAQVVECLSSMYEALGSIPCMKKKKEFTKENDSVEP